MQDVYINSSGGAHELYSEMWQAALVAGKTIRTGTPQARHDYASMPAADLAGLFRGLHPGALATGRFLAKEFRLERFEHLMDVGGGSGGAAIAACQACANLRATVVELPNTATIARSFIDDANLASRVKIMACDVIREVPKDACDAAVMRNFVQVLAPDEARRALKHVGAAMRENGELFIVGSVLDDNRLQPDTALGLNLVYLGMYENGQSYTEAEHRAWLAEAGFSHIRVSFGVAPNGATVIAARKSGAMGS